MFLLLFFFMFFYLNVYAKEDICISCHKTKTPGIVLQWESSKHSKVEVSCYDCHRAEKNDIYGFEHYGKRISLIVSPLNCSKCHEKEYLEQKGSHHAKAGQILGSLDNFLGEVLGGPPAVNAGCRQCHGSKVEVGKDGKPKKGTWPNTGMGRINPDGSLGSCSACHTRHTFSKAQARQPEACAKCHLGPDHPQMEVWEESKHGILYRANKENLNLEKDEWRAGKEYFLGPTCASCHMGAYKDKKPTHDVGERISWTLRPPISQKLNMVVYEDFSEEDLLGEDVKLPKVGEKKDEKKVIKTLSWKQRRENMQNLCMECHSKSFVEGAYLQFDLLVELYNEKFAKAVKAIVDELKKKKIITEADFDDPIEWIWYELWHHEGRRARHGAAMQGPDYAWWHGIYEVAKHFYEKFIPELERIAGQELKEELLKKYVYTNEGHLWHRDGLTKEQLKKIQEFYKERYQQ